MLPLESVRRWGVDLGNVIIYNLPPETKDKISKTFIFPKYRVLNHAEKLQEIDAALATNSHLVPLAIASLKLMIENCGAENVWIISQASGMERFFNSRLMHGHKIFEKTGLRRDHVRFVDEKKEKADVCQSLSIQGHIDDRGMTLFHMQNKVSVPVWFDPSKKDYKKWAYRFTLPILLVDDWGEIARFAHWQDRKT